MSYIDHHFLYDPSGIYLSGSIFLLHQKGPKNHYQFYHFRHGGGTHFVVLAQTLIYWVFKYITPDLFTVITENIFNMNFLFKQLIQFNFIVLRLYSILNYGSANRVKKHGY